MVHVQGGSGIKIYDLLPNNDNDRIEFVSSEIADYSNIILQEYKDALTDAAKAHIVKGSNSFSMNFDMTPIIDFIQDYPFREDEEMMKGLLLGMTLKAVPEKIQIIHERVDRILCGNELSDLIDQLRDSLGMHPDDSEAEFIPGGPGGEA